MQGISDRGRNFSAKGGRCTSKDVILACESGARSPTACAGGALLKFLGFLLLLAGWGLVLAAVILLAPGSPRAAFILAGVGVEIVGLVLVIRAHLLLRGAHD